MPTCEEDDEMRRRHPLSPLDDDDLLAEILLRLPPKPSSLPRASLVCKLWHILASDPGFSRRFRRHHRHKPHLLGFFMRDGKKLCFEPTLEHPNRVPEGRFSFEVGDRGHHFSFLGCRYGLLLMLHPSQGTLVVLVWDPVNGREHTLAIPPGFGKKSLINGAVLRNAHGDIHNFQVVLVSTDAEQGVITCVYSSETGVWGNLITRHLPPNISPGFINPSKPAVFVGDSLYMLLLWKPPRIIEFNVHRQSLAMIPLPPVPVHLNSEFGHSYSFMRAEGGGLGLLFASTSDRSLQLWKRKSDGDGVASWVLQRTIELDKLLSKHLQNHCGLEILGFAEGNNVVFLWAFDSVFMVQLDSLQFKQLPQITSPRCHPFEDVYAAGI